MAEYFPMLISDLVEMINAQEIILPAMQRNFVWPEDKIYHLFDSLMRDYPIGTFLFWDIKDDIFKQYAFNQFVRDVIDNKEKIQRGDVVSKQHSKYIAVLDGQQRITSLLVGVAGKWSTHMKGRRWDDPACFFDRFLCLDLLSYPQNEEEEYSFKFVKADEIEKIVVDTENNREHFWVKVATVFESSVDEDGKRVLFDSADYIDNFCVNHQGKLNDIERKKRREMLTTLLKVLRERQVINYYKAKTQNLAEVIEMFVRVNSGGQKLSASDLMLSVASGSLGNTDVHVKMQDAINVINQSVKDVDHGFKVDKELILTAGLMFTGAKSLSLQKQENYERDRMEEIFQSNWEGIVDALSNAIQYIEYLGFNGSKLTSKNLVLPIAYYFYKNNLSDTHKNSTSNRSACDKIFIRQWIIRAIINDVFMDGTGSTLVRIRDVIDIYTKYFPLDKLMEAKIKKPLNVNDEQIEEVLDCQYGDSRIIPLLMELTCRSIDTYHVDHIWPKKLMLSKRLIKRKYPNISDDQVDEYRNGCNRLANLQLLSPTENMEKSETLFGDWVKTVHSDPNDEYFKKNLIPANVSYDFNNFIEFKNEREKLLKNKIKESFPDDFNKIVKRFNLKGKL